MLAELAVGAVNALARLAAQLDLPTGFQGDLCLVALGADDVARLFLGLPAVTVDQFSKNSVDAARAEIRDRLSREAIDADFFVLGADAPLLARLAGVLEVGF